MTNVRLVEVVINNFKSFSGQWKTGELTSFNGILGRNGTGKSNIFDAILFALGEAPRNLRTRNVTDLAYKHLSQSPNSSRKQVSVELHLHKEDSLKVFKRSISNNDSQYSINGEVVSEHNYCKELAVLGLNISSKNCVVYQGEIEAVVQAQPLERTKIFEIISGSLDHKVDYDNWLSELTERETETKDLYQQKKFLMADHKRLLQIQKMERQKSNLQAQYEKKSRDLMLFKLKLIENKKQRAIADIQSVSEEKEQSERKCKRANEQLNAKIEKRGNLQKRVFDIEKEINRLEKEISENEAKCIEMNKQRQRNDHLKKSLVDAESSLASAIEADHKKAQTIENLKADLVAAEEIRDRERHVASQKFAESMDMRREDFDRYQELKKQMFEENFQIFQELEDLTRKYKSFSDQLDNEKRKKFDIDDKIDLNTRLIKSIDERQLRMEETIRKYEEKLSNCRSELDKLYEIIQKKDQVEAELNAVIEEIANYNGIQDQQRDLATEREVVEQLKVQFAERVIDRFYNLVHPIHKRYEVAMVQIFGKDLSAIVVDTTETAIECIKWMKSRNIPRIETFHPLNMAQVRPLQCHLRDLQNEREFKSVKLIYDVVTFDDPLENVVRSVIGSALVCDTPELAKKVAWKQKNGEVYTCVALNGTIYRKNFTFSGGQASLAKKAEKFSAARFREAKLRKQELTNQIREYQRITESDMEFKKKEIEGIEKSIGYLKSSLEKIHKEKIVQNEKLTKLNADLKEVNKNIKSVENKQKHFKRTQMNEMEAKWIAVQNRVFGDFCREFNIEDIRQFDAPLKYYEEMKKREIELDAHCVRIQHQIDFESQRDTNTNIQRWMNKCDKIRQQIKEDPDITQLEGTVAELCEELKQQNELLVNEKAKLKNAIEEINEARELCHQSTSELHIIYQAYAELHKDVMTLLDERHQILIAAKIKPTDHPLPILEGSLDSVSEFDDTSKTFSIEDYEAEDLIKFDFQSLPTALRDAETDDDIQKLQKQYEEELNTLNEEIMEITSVKQVARTINDVVNKLDEVKRNLKQRLERCKDARVEFEKVKNLRRHTFTKCLEKTNENVDKIYKQLCGCASAQAFLIAENPEEPYLSGIHYHCIPPLKRFFIPVSGSLSGGEMTIAALTLLLAIRSDRPPPFLLLDEVDAALDKAASKKLVEYLQKEAKMQILFVSLNIKLLRVVDTIIGLYRKRVNTGDYYSSFVTMSLEPYRWREDQNESL